MLATIVDRLNALHDDAHTVGWTPLGDPAPSLKDAFDRVQRDLGLRALAVPGRPKRSILDGYFRRAGVSGMTDPYFLETLVESDLLAVERPAVVAHEWAHLAGFADEAEANFVGWLTCLRGSTADRYSGWLFLYFELAAGVPAGDRDAAAARLTTGPRADLRAISDRSRRDVAPAVARAGERVYDVYLKANRVDAGVQSYNHVVRLVLGVRFSGDFVPNLSRSADR